MFQEWIRNRYGVYPETGFQNDPKFPEFLPDLSENDDGQSRVRNQGCDGLADQVLGQRSEDRVQMEAKKPRRIGEGKDQWVSSSETSKFVKGHSCIYVVLEVLTD